ncbi:hypothetical protein [Pelomonas sp. KK5]|uniref:hypothetical protein n=1 Tax=Pelomonas sp. KK5 TaxID=1855730 RepID=UPI00117FFF4B|nr:hypothetical protein [Pelomonas sp. KK5]
MRAALSILGLVIVLAIVMVNMKHQTRDLAQSRAAASAASQPSSGALPDPQAIGRQVNEAVMQGAEKASDAQP